MGDQEVIDEDNFVEETIEDEEYEEVCYKK